MSALQERSRPVRPVRPVKMLEGSAVRPLLRRYSLVRLSSWSSNTPAVSEVIALSLSSSVLRSPRVSKRSTLSEAMPLSLR